MLEGPQQGWVLPVETEMAMQDSDTTGEISRMYSGFLPIANPWTPNIGRWYRHHEAGDISGCSRRQIHSPGEDSAMSTQIAPALPPRQSINALYPGSGDIRPGTQQLGPD